MEEEESDEEKEKEEYFYRLICLVVDLGTEVLRKLFLKYIPQGQTVEAFLKSKKTVLDSLKKGVFNVNQLGMINATSPDVSSFDISLLYILISNITKIQAPNAGWFNVCPIPSDKSAGSLLMNLRRVRNDLSHRSKGKMKKAVFETFWHETQDILIELAGEVSQSDKDYVKEEINRIKTKQLVGDKGDKLETLLLWARQDDTWKMLSSLEELKKKQDSVLENIGPIKSTLQTFEAQISAKIDQQDSVLENIGPIKSTLQTFETQINAKIDEQSINLEGIKTHLQRTEDKLEALADQNRQIHVPGTSLGIKSSVPEIIYARPKERIAQKPVAQKGKSGAELIKKIT